MAVAWLREIEAYDDERNAVCTGRFECRVGDEAVELPYEAAVAWARERAERAYADVEWTRYALLGTDREIPPLPPELAERLRVGRRRPARDAWRDRVEAAPPVRWEIVVHLRPDDLRSEARPATERIVERVEARIAAAGCRDIARSSDELDAALADIDAQWRRAGKPEEFGWTTSSRLAYVLTATSDAPTYRPVLARVRAAALEELEAAAGRMPYEAGGGDIEGRWGLDVDVHPPGYEPQPVFL